MTKSFWYTLSGNSMAPALRDGESIFLEPLTGAPRRGDVVVLRLPTGWVVHRVLRANGNMVVTRGDACVRADPGMGRDAVLYRATQVLRDGQPHPIPAPSPALRLQLRRALARVPRVASLLRGLRRALVAEGLA
ncbi:MAG: S24/S26 family peptidase [Myxococcota bacterium]